MCVSPSITSISTKPMGWSASSTATQLRPDLAEALAGGELDLLQLVALANGGGADPGEHS
jgi:hypothetical protein